MLKYFFLSVLFVGISYGQNYGNIPPGTLKLNDSLFIDKTPVTNEMYLEFLKSKDIFWSMGKHEEIKTMSSYGINRADLGINSNAITKTHLKILSNLANQEKDYFTHPEYRQFPVLNITKAEAKEFCLWRTDMVLLLWAIKSENKKQRTEYPGVIKYRLPKVSELNDAKFHFSKSGDAIRLKGEAQKGLEIIENPENFYFYNIPEFTQAQKVYGNNSREQEPIEVPNIDIGFRCVCEIIE
ncbi:SUMF1/EgtB/PvdO family nonheme iron enzyme [Salegentibacter sp.]|uniref:SUMF1/EgtB/PvdO family nonheme iron enzyme n=1 Tax=Salegentibacter sp. TaxID=1903072 RepID=UPI0035654A64